MKKKDNCITLKTPHAENPSNQDVYVKDTTVAEIFDVTRITIWRWAREIEHFPKPIKLSPGCSRWRLKDVRDYATNLQAA